MRALLAKVTREVAIALADPAVRATVYRDLHASRYREHKLHFNTFLRSDAPSLLSAMAAARSATPGAAPAPGVATPKEAVLATLDSIVDLEFYMPVKSHFATWNGDADLLVASVLRDDGTVPDGFDLTGRVVHIASSEVPPATPTLVVVPVETDFSTVPPPAPAGVDAAVTVDEPGAYMTQLHVYDDHEGWGSGDPEFEIHTFVRNIDALYQDLVCSGKEAPSLYQFDADQDWWGNGVHDVLMATEERMASANERVQFQIWEDDTGECTGAAGASGGKPPKTSDEKIQQYAGWASSIINGVKTFITAPAPGHFWTQLSAVLTTIPVAYNLVTSFFRDDEVGVLALPNDCFSTASGPAYYEIRQSGGGHALTGWAMVDFRFGDERSPVCPTPPPPPPPPPPVLSVYMTGPSDVQPYSNCLFMAQTSGGTEPYSWAWTADGAPVGNGSSWYRHSAGTTLFNLTVVVTDATGAEVGSETSVTVSSGAPECLDQ
jgi:hypothetical protein